MPTWTPFSAGQAFALSHRAWIVEEQAKHARPLLESGQKIGKLHYLRFELVLQGQSVASRVTGTEIVIRLLPTETVASASVQERAYKASIRAMKREAERLLPPRVANLAHAHSKQYSSLAVKHLKRRWGSCDSHQALTFNLFLMELPWDYIDYVILHELAHTLEMNHGPAFWKLLSSMEPRARDLSRTLRSHQPAIGTWAS